MLFSKIAVLGEDLAVHPDCYVGVREETIEYLGTEPPAEDFGEVYDGKNRLLIPALANAHSHAPMTLLRGYAENLALEDWLNKKVFPFEAKMKGGDVYWGSLLAFAEMLRFGVVSSTEMYYFGEEMARAALETGFKANLSLGVLCFDGRGFSELPIYSEYQGLLRMFHGAGNGRIRVDLCIHGEYTSTPRVVREAADWAKENGLRVHLHLSETKKEHEECKARHEGMTPARYFESLGLFDRPATAAHCVWLEGEDFDILRRHGVAAACCPVSNLKLASGFADLRRLLKSGVRVAPGTDGAASKNNLNLFEEMKLAAILYKASSGDPTAVTPREAFAAATKNGFLSQGREESGAVRAGGRADLAVIDLAAPSMHPVHDPLGNLVLAANGGEVCLTMADGRVLYRDGEYTAIDLERVVFEAQCCAARILTEL